MTIREIEKEGWTKFINSENYKDEEISNLELARSVFNAYKHVCMYSGKDKAKKPLVERFENLDTFEREVENITGIYLVNNACINSVLKPDQVNNYIVIDDKYGSNVVLEANTGLDCSYSIGELQTNKENSKIMFLYKGNSKSKEIKLSLIEEVSYHTDAILRDEKGKEKYHADLLEIKDRKGNLIYIDFRPKKFFISENTHKLVNSYDHKIIFKRDCKY